MTDKEIIKALECLYNRILKSKFAEEVTENEIMGLIDALALINRQQAEIERLTKNYNSLNAQEEKAHQYCKNVCEPNYRAEIERLKSYHKNEFERLRITYDKYLESKTQELKAEAVKEFAERLKEEINIRPTHSKEQNKYVFFLIDNLVKEMVGE